MGPRTKLDNFMDDIRDGLRGMANWFRRKPRSSSRSSSSSPSPTGGGGSSSLSLPDDDHFGWRDIGRGKAALWITAFVGMGVFMHACNKSKTTTTIQFDGVKTTDRHAVQQFIAHPVSGKHSTDKDTLVTIYTNCRQDPLDDEEFQQACKDNDRDAALMKYKQGAKSMTVVLDEGGLFGWGSNKVKIIGKPQDLERLATGSLAKKPDGSKKYVRYVDYIGPH